MKKLVGSALLGLLAWSGGVHAPSAHALTISAQVCGAGGCPPVLDAGTRTNFVGVLGANRWTVLPYTFTDASVTFSGYVAALNVAGQAIYLRGQGVATTPVANAGNFFLDVGISQNFQTQAGVGTFGGFNVGSCNLNATAAGSGEVAQAFVNGAALATNGTTACSPFVQTFGPAAGIAVGAVTNLSAVAVFGFGAGGGQAITLPYGDDDPSSANTFDFMTSSSDISLDQLDTDLSDLGNAYSEQVPEPLSLSILGIGIMGIGAARARAKSARKKVAD